eukprot:c34775_g1_i1 orf=2-478(+)
MPERDVVSWAAMIAGYAQCGNGEEGFQLFGEMQREGVKPDQVAYLTLLKACASSAFLEHGTHVHSHIIKSGLESNVSVGNTLIDMYAKCRSIEQARCMFDRMCERDVVSWNAMLAGYAQYGNSEEVLRLFQQMQWESMKPDRVTFISILKACASLTAL